MTDTTRLRLGLLVAGLAVWGAGFVFNDSTTRWVGLGLVLAAFLARFVSPRNGGM